MAIRAQLPVRSPVRLGDLGKALTGGSAAFPDPRPVLREELERRFGAGQVVLTASGTHALTLALRIASDRLGGRPPVLLPAWTCFDVAAAAVGAGVEVVFYDLDPITLAPDLDSLQKGLQEGGRIVVANPLYGFPLPWDQIRTLVAEVGGIVVEDAAQGAHGRWDSRWLGSFGDLSILSFGRGKGWTGAGGGALLLRGELAGVEVPALQAGAGRWSTLGRAAAMGVLGVPALYGVPRRLPFLGLGETHYHPPTPPADMGVAEAALIMASGAQAQVEANLRRSNAAHLEALLQGRPGIRIPRAVPGGDPGFLRFPVLLPRESHPSERTAIRLGIGAGYPLPLPLLEPLRSQMRNPAGSFPGAEELASDLLTLPTHSGVGEKERFQLAAAVSPSGHGGVA